MQINRLIRIAYVFWRYGLYEFAIPFLGASRFFKPLFWLRRLRSYSSPRGKRLREAFEELGPIFVKFGQMISTRRDLFPLDVIVELDRLQDRVAPFPGDRAKIEIERGLARKLEDVFSDFDSTPIASASIAQIHFATLLDGRAVAVKVVRPGMKTIIDRDLQWLRFVARILKWLSVDARRLRLQEVIDEFDRSLHDELDLVREAANASQLRRNFAGSNLLRIPDIYWDWCTTNVMTMERMDGIPIGQIDRMRDAGIDFKKLSKEGVEIFFIQVFQHGFFHADMHPGNILVGIKGDDFNRFIALDFGIVGTLSTSDKNYLAQNFLAFFRRDYRRVAELHVESGWAPRETRIEELEGAIRSCCEPFFDRPLKSISLGFVLLRLFQTSRRFKIEIQPQLVLLQKTLLNVEGLGRQLDPDLDLWVTAKPILERWMKRQVGFSGWIAGFKEEVPKWAATLPEIPRLVHQVLMNQVENQEKNQCLIDGLLKEREKTRLFIVILVIFFGFFFFEYFKKVG